MFQPTMHNVPTNNVDANLKKWAKSANRFQLMGKLVTQAADAHAGDTYYHVKCYLHLRDSARTTVRKESETLPHPNLIQLSQHR